MSEDIKKESMDMELSLEAIEQVSGGMDPLENVIRRIKRDGNAAIFREELKAKGKPAAAAHCCELYPEYCGLCAAAVSML